MAQNPDPVDIHVGTRLRLRRTLMGLSQEKLGRMLGLTFQQVQKYERGANRMGSSRLYRISRILEVPVAWFFEDMPAEARATVRGLADDTAPSFETDHMTRRETLELVRAYYRIPDDRVRKRLFELVKSVANIGTDPDSADGDDAAPNT